MSRLREFALKILLRKEKGIMAVIYATLIVKGEGQEDPRSGSGADSEAG